MENLANAISAEALWSAHVMHMAVCGPCKAHGAQTRALFWETVEAYYRDGE